VTIVAQCADGAEALDAIEAHEPDVVVMDIRMRVMNGIEATRRIRDAEGPPVLILTTFDDDETLWGAIDAGAAGFVLKDASAVDLIRAVRTVASGAAWLDPQVTPRVLAVYRTTVLPQARQQVRAAELTDREHDVLRLIAEGATNAEIADTLHVSGGTVKSHVGSIFTKLGARDRAAAIVYAYQHGIASPPGPG
jgi:DNA-binding NarL/FixJ family response regulator